MTPRRMFATSVLVCLLFPLSALAVGPVAPSPDACAVEFSVHPTWSASGSDIDGSLTCQEGDYRFIGHSTATPDLCPGGSDTSVTYTGTEGLDSTVAETWTLSGASGVYTLAAGDAAGRGWTGAVETVGVPVLGGMCDPTITDGAGEATETAASGDAEPGAYLCRATGTVSGVGWGSGETGRTGLGDASGSGSCEVGGATWSMSYSGAWSLNDPDFQSSPCPQDSYAVTLTLRRGADSMTLRQTWTAGPDRGGVMTVTGNQGPPLGGGTLTKNTEPCTVATGGGFTTTETWAFVDDA